MIDSPDTLTKELSEDSPELESSEEAQVQSNTGSVHAGSLAGSLHKAFSEQEASLDIPQETQPVYDFAKSQDIFSSSRDERIKCLRRLDASGVSALITTVHSVVAPDTNLTPNDGTAKMLNKKKEIVHILMSPEDRFSFISEATDLMVEVLASLGENPTEDAKEAALIRISNLIALTTVITHPFIDGNGRTSRTLALLIRDGLPHNPHDVNMLKLSSSARPPRGDQFGILGFIPHGAPNMTTWSNSIKAAAGLDYELTATGQNDYHRTRVDVFMSPFNDQLESEYQSR